MSLARPAAAPARCRRCLRRAAFSLMLGSASHAAQSRRSRCRPMRGRRPGTGRSVPRRAASLAEDDRTSGQQVWSSGETWPCESPVSRAQAGGHKAASSAARWKSSWSRNATQRARAAALHGDELQPKLQPRESMNIKLLVVVEGMGAPVRSCVHRSFDGSKDREAPLSSSRPSSSASASPSALRKRHVLTQKSAG